MSLGRGGEESSKKNSDLVKIGRRDYPRIREPDSCQEGLFVAEENLRKGETKTRNIIMEEDQIKCKLKLGQARGLGRGRTTAD